MNTIVRAFVFAANAAAATIASAQTTTWINPAGGLWHDAANWSDGVPNADGARASFTASPTAPVVLDANAQVTSLYVGCESLELDLANHLLIVPWSSSARVVSFGAPGFTSSASVRHGTVGGLLGVALNVGTSEGAVATLTVDGVHFEVSESCFGAGTGRAIVNIIGGGASFAFGGAGMPVTRLGAGSEVRVRGAQWNPQLLDSRGLVEVSDGGYASFDLASTFSPQSVVRVVGSGSRASGVAYSSQGSLEILEGGRVEGEFRASLGSLLVSGFGSLLEAGSVGVQRHSRVLDHATLLAPQDLSGSFEIAGGATVQSRGGACSLMIRDEAVVSGPDTFYLIGYYPFSSSVSQGGVFSFGQARVWAATLDVLDGGRVQGGEAAVGGSASGLPQGDDSNALPYTTLSFDSTISANIGTLSLFRGSSIGLFNAAGTLTGNIILDGILRPAAFTVNGTINASATGLVEISLDAAAPPITASGACNLAPALIIVTGDAPIVAANSWPLIHASSLTIGDLALPTLPDGLEWTLTQTPTDLSIAAAPAVSRCRPSIDTLSPPLIDGYVGEPITLAAVASGPVISMRWHKDGEPLSDDAIYSGTSSPTLTINSSQPRNLARYHLIATGPCGMTASNAIDASIRCGGDFNQDFVVDGDDVIDFFGPWDAGDIAADWNHDGAVDGDDVIGFFAKWDAGC